jgi:hypothetical protein
LAFSGQTITIFRGASNFPSVNFTGGVPFIVATLAGGSFPPGVSIDNSSNYPRFSGAPTQIGQWTANIKITDSYSPPETVTGTIKFYVNGPPPQITADFPHGVVGVPYSYSLSAVNGTRPFQWQVTGLPAGLSADANGNITGTPTTTGIFQNVTIKLTDSSQPTAAVVTSSGVIRVKAFSGRNDSPATATAATTGIYDASLSPYADAAGIEQPDHDYFRVTVAPGTILQLTVDPRYPSQVDPLTELVDVNGARISNCKVPGSTSFASPCLSDDFDPGVNHSSHLEWQNNSGADQTLYIHVLEWSGDARPDFKYRLTINGAK